MLNPQSPTICHSFSITLKAVLASHDPSMAYIRRSTSTKISTFSQVFSSKSYILISFRVQSNCWCEVYSHILLAYCKTLENNDKKSEKMAEDLQKVNNNFFWLLWNVSLLFFTFWIFSAIFSDFYHYFLKFHSMQAVYDYRLHINNFFGP